MASTLLSGALLPSLLLAVSSVAHADDATLLTLPARTGVQLRLQDAVSSATAAQGQHFRLVVDADVLVQGLVVIPQGTPASGTVLAAERAGRMGAGGRLSLKLDHVQLGARRVRLHWTLDSTDRSQEQKARMLSALIAPLGFAADGKDIEIPAGTRITASTKDSVDLSPAALESSATPGLAPATEPR